MMMITFDQSLMEAVRRGDERGCRLVVKEDNGKERYGSPDRLRCSRG
jgi:hypothetical protein